MLSYVLVGKCVVGGDIPHCRDWLPDRGIAWFRLAVIGKCTLDDDRGLVCRLFREALGGGKILAPVAAVLPAADTGRRGPVKCSDARGDEKRRLQVAAAVPDRRRSDAAHPIDWIPDDTGSERVAAMGN